MNRQPAASYQFSSNSWRESKSQISQIAELPLLKQKCSFMAAAAQHLGKRAALLQIDRSFLSERLFQKKGSLLPFLSFTNS